MNIRIDIEYDGEPYHGWQRQKGHTSVQGVLEEALSSILKRPVILHGSGRTDSGVHARGQVANFVAENAPIPPDRWGLALNTRLPPHIRVLRSFAVPDSFHAQRSAVSKVYEYRILNRSHASSLDRRVYFWPHPLSWDKMAEALPYFVGEHDFRAFQSGPPVVKTTVRKIYRFEMRRDPYVEGLVTLTIEGNGFLRQMVRNIVGTVMEVGQGLCEPEDILRIFETGERSVAGRAVPARGLFMVKVNYGLDGIGS
jgi:tRNA pseudouridine38-40 synthase